MIEDTFNARYGLTRTITEVETNEHEIREFIISGKSHYGRSGGSMEDGNYFIDFEGGPFVPLGGDMQNIYPKVEGRIIGITEECADQDDMMSVRVRVDTNNHMKERREYTEVYMEDIRTLLTQVFDKIDTLGDGSKDFLADKDIIYGQWWNDLEHLFNYPDYKNQM